MRADTKEEFAVGQRVCILGFGTANLFHSHSYKVKRITKTMIVAEAVNHADVTSRFHRDTQRSIPYQAYGGTYVSGRCQK